MKKIGTNACKFCGQFSFLLISLPFLALLPFKCHFDIAKNFQNGFLQKIFVERLVVSEQLKVHLMIFGSSVDSCCSMVLLCTFTSLCFSKGMRITEHAFIYLFCFSSFLALPVHPFCFSDFMYINYLHLSTKTPAFCM